MLYPIELQVRCVVVILSRLGATLQRSDHSTENVYLRIRPAALERGIVNHDQNRLESAYNTPNSFETEAS